MSCRDARLVDRLEWACARCVSCGSCLDHPCNPAHPAHRKTQGAGAFLLCYILTSVGLLLKMRGRVQKYLPVRWLGFLLGDVANHVLSFLLFWCMAYTLVHIY